MAQTTFLQNAVMLLYWQGYKREQDWKMPAIHFIKKSENRKMTG